MKKYLVLIVLGLIVTQSLTVGFADSTSVPITGIIEKVNSSSSDSSSGGSGGGSGGGSSDSDKNDKWHSKPTEPAIPLPKETPDTGAEGLGYIESESIGAVLNMKGFIVPNKSDTESVPNYVYNIGESKIAISLTGSINDIVPSQMLYNRMNVGIDEEIEYKMELTNNLISSTKEFNAIYNIEKVNK